MADARSHQGDGDRYSILVTGFTLDGIGQASGKLCRFLNRLAKIMKVEPNQVGFVEFTFDHLGMATCNVNLLYAIQGLPKDAVRVRHTNVGSPFYKLAVPQARRSLKAIP
jgi:hypothetical protein